MEGEYKHSSIQKVQNKEYLIKNACYSVTKYYLCKRNNKRSLLGRKQRSQVARSFPNRYLFSFTNMITSLFSMSCIFRIILVSNFACFVIPINIFLREFSTRKHEFGIKILVKFIYNTENFTIFVLNNHSGFCLYFIYLELMISADYRVL